MILAELLLKIIRNLNTPINTVYYCFASSSSSALRCLPRYAEEGFRRGSFSLQRCGAPPYTLHLFPTKPPTHCRLTTSLLRSRTESRGVRSVSISQTSRTRFSEWCAVTIIFQLTDDSGSGVSCPLALLYTASNRPEDTVQCTVVMLLSETVQHPILFVGYLWIWTRRRVCLLAFIVSHETLPRLREVAHMGWKTGVFEQGCHQLACQQTCILLWTKKAAFKTVSYRNCTGYNFLMIRIIMN